jgi:hypothetical protein
MGSVTPACFTLPARGIIAQIRVYGAGAFCVAPVLLRDDFGFSATPPDNSKVMAAITFAPCS